MNKEVILLQNNFKCKKEKSEEVSLIITTIIITIIIITNGSLITYSALLLSDSDMHRPNFHNFYFFHYYYSRKILKRDLVEFAGRKKCWIWTSSQCCQVGVFMPTFSNLAYCKLVGSKK